MLDNNSGSDKIPTAPNSSTSSNPEASALNLQEFKKAHLERHTQFILFDPEGRILESCNTLLDLDGVNLNVFDLFPLLGDSREILSMLRTRDKSLVYPAVELALGSPAVEGDTAGEDEERVLDLRLKAIEGTGAWRGVLIMHDNTEVYDAIMRIRKRTEKAEDRVLKVVR